MMPARATANPKDYHAYVLRLWRESDSGPWRISLQETGEGKRRGFADLASLMTHLEQLLEEEQINESLKR